MAKSIEYELKVTDAGASAAMDRFAKRASQPIVREVFIRQSVKEAAMAKTQILAENRAQAAFDRGRKGADDTELRDMAGYYRQAAVEAEKLYAIEQKRAQITAAANARHAASGMDQAERDAMAAEIRRMRRGADDYSRRERVNRRLFGDTGTAATAEAGTGGESGVAGDQSLGMMNALKTFRHSAAVVGMEYLGRRVAEVTKSIADLRKEYDQLGAAGAAQKILEAQPIAGEWAKAGASIREALTGEREEIDEIAASTRIANSLWETRLRLIRDSRRAEEEHADVVRNLYNQRVNANLSSSSAAVVGELAKMEDERIAAEKKVVHAREAAEASGKDPAIQEAEDKLRQVKAEIAEARQESARIADLKKRGYQLGNDEEINKKNIARLEARAATYQGAITLRQDTYQKAIDDQAKAQAELDDLNSTHTERRLKLERDAADELKQLDAEAAADRLRAMGKSSEAELELLKEALRKKADAYNRDKEAGVGGITLELRRKEMENADLRVRDAEDAVARDEEERRQKMIIEQKANERQQAMDQNAAEQEYLRESERINRKNAAVADRFRPITPRDLSSLPSGGIVEPAMWMHGYVGAGQTQALTDAQQAQKTLEDQGKKFDEMLNRLDKIAKALADPNRPVVKFAR